MPDWYANACPLLKGLYDWQTLITGILALAAGGLTVWGAFRATRQQIAAAERTTKDTIGATRAAAQLQVDAAKEQTAVAIRENQELRRADKRRRASDSLVAGYLLVASLETIVGQIISVLDGTSGDDSTVLPGHVAQGLRQRISKPAFKTIWDHLGALGGLAIGEFVGLDSKIEQVRENASTVNIGGLRGELSSLEAMVNHLRDLAHADMKRANDAIAETEM